MPYQKSNPVKDKEGRSLWVREQDRCACCHITYEQTLTKRYPVGFQTHHIIKPGRSDERCNYLCLCELCHRLAEGHRVASSVRGEYLPVLTIGMCLALKRAINPSEHDPARLTELYTRGLPDEEPLPLGLRMFRDQHVRFIHPPRE